MTTPETDTPQRRRVMRSFRIDEISAVDRPAQAGAKALLVKRAPGLPDATVDRDHCEHRDRAALVAEQMACDGTLAAAALGIELPADLAAAPEVDTVLDPDADPEEVAAYRERARRYRDRVEREGRLRSPGTSARTLLEIDLALEARAAELRRDGETAAQAFERAWRERDPAFAELLTQRERVATEGV